PPARRSRRQALPRRSGRPRGVRLTGILRAGDDPRRHRRRGGHRDRYGDRRRSPGRPPGIVDLPRGFRALRGRHCLGTHRRTGRIGLRWAVPRPDRDRDRGGSAVPRRQRAPAADHGQGGPVASRRGDTGRRGGHHRLGDRGCAAGGTDSARGPRTGHDPLTRSPRWAPSRYGSHACRWHRATPADSMFPVPAERRAGPRAEEETVAKPAFPIAIVTGAGRGIGAAVAQRLASDGFGVALADVDDAACRDGAETIRATGGKAIGIRTDVGENDQVESTIERVAEELGPPTTLVNNAGVIRDNLLFKMTEDDWDTVLDVHLRGAFLMSRAVQRHMTEQGWGRIVNLSSIGALGNRGQANYSAAKAGMQGFTKTLALELGRFGVTANAIAPGF